jgi:DNA invertase Pin-like site-specific DNA recombinase
MSSGIRCAALFRVSTVKQAQRRNDADESLPVQREAIRRFLAEYHADWPLVCEYAEEGVSAYHNSSAARDVLQDMLRAASRHEFEVLLVFKADRLSRQSFEYPVILSQLGHCGIQVISVADTPGGRSLDTEGQMDKLLRFIEGWQAETESYNTSVRVSEAMRQMAEKGKWTGGTPSYGFRLTASREGAVPLNRPARIGNSANHL